MPNNFNGIRITHIFLVSIALLLALAPQAQAWKASTHYRIVQAAYDGLPENIRANLNLGLIKDGSTRPDQYVDKPDEYGQTYPNHFQPKARAQAEHWLGVAKSYYRNGDFDNASLALGIASHYIADACCLAHNPPYTYYWNLHEEFEDRGTRIWPKQPWGISNFDLSQMLEQAETNASVKWERWIQTRDISIVQEDLNNAAVYTYNAWCRALDVEPSLLEKWASPIDLGLVAVALMVLIVCVAVGIKRYHTQLGSKFSEFLFKSCNQKSSLSCRYPFPVLRAISAFWSSRPR